MNCFYHPDLISVASCQFCGKGLCRECAAKHSPCLCDECAELIKKDKQAQRRLKRANALIDTTSEFIKAIIIGLICSFGLSYLYGNISEVDITLRILFFFIPFGWAMITYIEQWLPTIFLSGPFFLGYILIKMTASVFLGAICFAYQVIRYIIGIIKSVSAK
ncbi:MAG: hypothetical protein IJM75_04145 [Ruminococcus sp.]|nr:hypothetical protein [Ruminococcus sp.]